MAHGDFKDLNRRTAADKVLRDKAVNTAKNPKYDASQRGLASMAYNIFGKITSGGKSSLFKYNIWSLDLADMQFIRKFNKRFRIVLCVIDIYSKYAWVIPLKDKKGAIIINDFQNNLNESNRKPKKIWVDKDSEFYNRSLKLWLEKEWYRNVFNT